MSKGACQGGTFHGRLGLITPFGRLKVAEVTPHEARESTMNGVATTRIRTSGGGRRLRRLPPPPYSLKGTKGCSPPLKRQKCTMSEETMSLDPTTIKWMGSRLGREAMESRVQILEAKGMSPKEAYLMPRRRGAAKSSPPVSEDH